MQIYFAIPPILAFLGPLGEFLLSTSKIQNFYHIINLFFRLFSGVSRLSLNKLIKTKPRTGWVRYVSLSAEANKQILALKEENEALKAKLKQVEDEDPKGIENLQQGDDKVTVGVSFYYIKTHYLKIDISWNRIVSILAPVLVDESSEDKMKSVFVDSIREDILKKYKDYVHNHPKIEEESFQQIKVQLIALRIIELSDRKRTVKDTETYWHLTPYGFRVMMNLKALKKIAF